MEEIKDSEINSGRIGVQLNLSCPCGPIIIECPVGMTAKEKQEYQLLRDNRGRIIYYDLFHYKDPEVKSRFINKIVEGHGISLGIEVKADILDDTLFLKIQIQD